MTNRIDKGLIEQLYLEAQKSTLQIAKELNLPQYTVARYLRKQGLTRTYSEARELAHKYGRTGRKIDPVLLKRLYIDEKLPAPEVARKLGAARNTIVTALKELGLLRSRSESMKLAYATGRIKCKWLGLRGEKAINWKGGKTASRGYIQVFAPDHHRANKKGYVWEHIFVWERHHGRQLPPNWLVHHINGKGSDNRPENLLATPKHCHHSKLLQKAMQKRIRELEAKCEAIKIQGTLALS